MVGYIKDDTMTSNQKLIAGCVSGVVTRFLTQPLDVIKIRTQLQRKTSRRKHRSVYETSKKRFGTVTILGRNILDFSCGLCAGCCTATLVSPIEVIRVRQMLVKEQYRGLLNGARAVYMSGGIFAFYEGLSASVLMSHREENKYFTPTTSRNLVKCVNLVQCITDTVKAEGFLGLYRGLKVTIYKAVSQNLITFTTYEMTCYCIREFKKR
ncbi:unnamed protein product [Leptidea sinapis]|uniref:Uncharacterized protein n=1 Tax=Leptidea sinapis TaxID=189913 RepID=A0A5E4PMX7_9NEOP|nr:unnamed protein product [Leptidea sinapis]